MSNEETTTEEQTAIPGVKQERSQKWEVKYTFSNDELLGLGQRVVRLIEERQEVEDRKKSANSQFKMELDRLSEQINQTSNKIGNGYTMQDMDCEVWFNRPEDGLKSYVRPDTGAIVFTTPMTLEERQMLLPLDEQDDAPPVVDGEFFEEEGEHQFVVNLLDNRAKELELEMDGKKGKKLDALEAEWASFQKAMLILEGRKYSEDTPAGQASAVIAMNWLIRFPHESDQDFTPEQLDAIDRAITAIKPA